VSEYQNSLKEEGRWLKPSTLIKSHFRDDISEQIIHAVSKGKSVILVGHSGVGRTVCIHQYVKAMSEDDAIDWHHMVEISCSTLVTNTRYVGDMETKVDAILTMARSEEAVLLITDIWNLTTTGVGSSQKSSAFDVMQPALQQGTLVLFGEISPEQHAILKNNSRFAACFEFITVPPLSATQILAALNEHNEHLDLNMSPALLDYLLQQINRFLPKANGPGPAKKMLDRIHAYRYEKDSIGEHDTIDEVFVDKVFAIYSGLPRFIISTTETRAASEIRRWFKERIIGQTEAIEAVVETIALFKAGLNDPNKPIGSALFIGPTGVGKTEVAKALARYLFGHESRLLRFDMSEYADYYDYNQLIGSLDKPESPAKLLDPVQMQPFQVILFDEIEKGHVNVRDLLLQVLDEGNLTSARGEAVSFKNTIIIVTSNVSAELDSLSGHPIGFVADTNSKANPKQLQNALTQVFRPEFLNRFQHIVRFHTLELKHVSQIAKLELESILKRNGIADRNLVVEIDDAVLQRVIADGYDPTYGARGLKRIIQRQVILPLANYLLETAVTSGSILQVVLRNGQIHVRTAAKPKLVISKPEGSDALNPSELKPLVEQFKQQQILLQHLASELGEVQLIQQLAEIDESKQNQQFWSKPDQAYRQVMAAESIHQRLDRLNRLRDRLSEFENDINLPHTRWEMQRLEESLNNFTSSLHRARIELALIGDAGNKDALLFIKPLKSDVYQANFLYDIYRRFAEHANYGWELLCEPLTEEEPILIRVSGPYAFGYLCGESGYHRLRFKDDNATYSVEVFAIDETSEPAPTGLVYGGRYALKKKGLFGNKIRSHLDVLNLPNFMLQNGNTLTENTQLAEQLAVHWPQQNNPDTEIIRRYDSKPFLLKDYATQVQSGRKESLKPEKFTELLRQRAEIIWQQNSNTTG